MKIINDKCQRVPIYLWSDSIEDGALEQAQNLSQLPFVFDHVALMPDVHQGYGMPIGGVVAFEDAISPNCVGVDIGCGMIAVKTSLSVYDFPQEDLSPLLKFVCERIHRYIPLGFNVHKHPQDWYGFKCHLDIVDNFYSDNHHRGWSDSNKWRRIVKGLGTLGGGNHFIEIQQEVSQHGEIWLMIHSGSRYLGKLVADYYHKMALELMGDEVIHKDLAHIPIHDPLAQSYLRDMEFALDFAQENRNRMMDTVKVLMSDLVNGDIEFDEPINIHHNYAVKETHSDRDLWVHRKGATSAKFGEVGIIPGSMGSPSYIVVGKGNPMSFNSCSHGAGRKMGRMAASRKLDSGECELLMDGVVFDGFGTHKQKKMKGMKDLGESPLAYKDINEVIENQRDLIQPLHELRPIANVKG